MSALFAVLGGEDSLRSELDSVEYYIIDDDKWVYGQPMQEARFHPCAGIAGDKLMVMGGAGGSIATNTVEVKHTLRSSFSVDCCLSARRRMSGLSGGGPRT